MNNETESRLSARMISKSFELLSGQRIQVLDDITFEITQKEILVVMGPSGCGKSTLMKLLAGWERPCSGQMVWNQNPILRPGPDRPICVQDSTIWQWKTVLENVLFAPKLRGLDTSYALELIEDVGLASFIDEYPSQLSGGMQKRVELARVFASAEDNALILLDEAFGSVDLPRRLKLHKLTEKMIRSKRHSALVTTHDAWEASFVGDRIIMLTDKPAQVSAELAVPFSRPRSTDLVKSKAFQEFVGQVQVLAAQVGRDEIDLLEKDGSGID